MRAAILLAVLAGACHSDTPPVTHTAAASTGGGCPFNFGKKPAAHVAAKPDGPRAPARPALGFTLGTTTIAAVDAWAAQHAVGCKHRHGDATIECSNVPAALLGGGLDGTSVWFGLDDRGVLRSIKTVRDTAEVAPIAVAFADTEAALTAADGAPRTRDGSAEPAVLAHGALRQAMVEYRYWDYRAVVRATNMGPGHGFTLTESYTAYD